MKKYDVIVIGTGVAGMVAAIRLSEEGLKVGIFTKAKDPNLTNTNLAQGGIIYSEDDKLAIDIYNASSKTSYMTCAEKLVKESKNLVDKYLHEKAQTEFEREDGKLKFTKEAAHSLSRIIYKGDYTGRSIQVSLMNYLKTLSNITIHTEHVAIDLLTLNHHGLEKNNKYESNKVLGAYFLHDNKVETYLANYTILATGGIANLYLNTTNSSASRGDGHAMAKRAGCELMDMEFIQFHPTTLFLRNSNKILALSSKNFLLTEAIRGEGGYLFNQNGERFMDRYDSNMELASRDIVSQSIMKEIIRTQTDCVYLDISHKDGEWIKNRFPEIYKHCLENGIDMTKDRIPAIPSAHYTCGGVKTDLNGKTSLDGLYAVGEVACTGLHGANRLASTSLLEGLSFAHFAANEILSTNEQHKEYKVKEWDYSIDQEENDWLEQDVYNIKTTLWNYAGIIRNQKNLTRARLILQQLKSNIEEFYKKAKLTDELIGVRNSIEVSLLVVEQSVKNNNPVGCFYKVTNE